MAEINWKYNVGDRIVDYHNDGSIKRDMTLIDRKIKVVKVAVKRLARGYCMNRQKYYKYKCNVCSWDEGWIGEKELHVQKHGCSCCRSRTIVKGINDVATTHKEVVQYFKNADDAFAFSAHSDKCPELICPRCGSIRTDVSVDSLTRQGFHCQECSDKISYGEKFINALLKQLDVTYERQLSKKKYAWCGKYKYDFWFNKNGVEYIIEVHGEQHYTKKKNWRHNYWEIQKNDKEKSLLAMKNGFDAEHYIIINCRNSDLEWIKKSICESALNKVFDLSKIDWQICDDVSSRSIICDVCKYWEDNKHLCLSTKDIGKHFEISRNTVLSY